MFPVLNKLDIRAYSLGHLWQSQFLARHSQAFSQLVHPKRMPLSH